MSLLFARPKNSLHKMLPLMGFVLMWKILHVLYCGIFWNYCDVFFFSQGHTYFYWVIFFAKLHVVLCHCRYLNILQLNKPLLNHWHTVKPVLYGHSFGQPLDINDQFSKIFQSFSNLNVIPCLLGLSFGWSPGNYGTTYPQGTVLVKYLRFLRSFGEKSNAWPWQCVCKISAVWQDWGHRAGHPIQGMHGCHNSNKLSHVWNVS